jgi:hypothetical protein
MSPPAELRSAPLIEFLRPFSVLDGRSHVGRSGRVDEMECDPASMESECQRDPGDWLQIISQHPVSSTLIDVTLFWKWSGRQNMAVFV